MSHALQSVILALVFVASIIKDKLAPRYRRTYWGLMVLCLIAGLTNQAWEHVEDARTRKINNGRELVEHTRDIINDGMNRNDIARLESAFDDLLAAKETLQPYTSSPDAYILSVSDRRSRKMEQARPGLSTRKMIANCAFVRGAWLAGTMQTRIQPPQLAVNRHHSPC